MDQSVITAMLVVMSQSIINISSVHADSEMMGQSEISNHTRYSVNDAWASLIWNRFPAEVYPLFLTPLLEAGRIEEAQTRSRVWNVSKDGDVESYSGYITVDRKYYSNMFFWFFPAENQKEEAPVLLWLNGGPGRTSLVGALLENGPLEIRERRTQLYRRAVSWTQNFSMLYIDNPVGVGYSFTKDDAGLSRSMADVTRNLYSTLIQFFQLFPQYSHQPFYAGGQSYAGKYIPSLGYHIHERNMDPKTPQSHIINLKGIYLGAGFCDPLNMLPEFPEFMYHVGIFSDETRRSLKEQFHSLLQAWHQSGQTDDDLVEDLNWFFFRAGFSHGIFHQDHLLGSQMTNAHLMDQLNEFMNSTEAGMNLHVGYASTNTHRKSMIKSRDVRIALSADFMANTSRENGILMDHYKVLHYSGNLDVVVNVPMTEAFLRHVQWAGQEEYRLHTRQPWIVRKQPWTVAGWAAVIRNLTRVVIRNSGHMAPYDQPERTLEMMQNFIFDRSFFETDQKD